jgi:hypothetical protein
VGVLLRNIFTDAANSGFVTGAFESASRIEPARRLVRRPVLLEEVEDEDGKFVTIYISRFVGVNVLGSPSACG